MNLLYLNFMNLIFERAARSLEMAHPMSPALKREELIILLLVGNAKREVYQDELIPLFGRPRSTVKDWIDGLVNRALIQKIWDVGRQELRIADRKFYRKAVREINEKRKDVFRYTDNINDLEQLEIYGRRLAASNEWGDFLK